MCIINHSRNFIFVHVPKCAGTSLTNFLSSYTRYCDLEIGGSAFGEAVHSAYKGRFGLGKHAKAYRIREIVGEQIWTSYFKFAFVRDPFERIVSLYNFYHSWYGAEKHPFFEEFFKCRNLNEFILSDIAGHLMDPDELLLPQTWWLFDEQGEDPNPIVDFVGRVETIGADVEFVRSKIDPFAQYPLAVPADNASQKFSSTASLSSAARERIRELYESDFQLLGYAEA